MLQVLHTILTLTRIHTCLLLGTTTMVLHLLIPKLEVSHQGLTCLLDIIVIHSMIRHTWLGLGLLKSRLLRLGNLKM